MLSSPGERSSPTCGPPTPLSVTQIGLPLVRGRQRLRRTPALLALRADEERAVGLVPRAPPVDVDALGPGQVLQRADQLLVPREALRVDRARAGGDPVALAAVGGGRGPVRHT